jgi:hypothetical protein
VKRLLALALCSLLLSGCLGSTHRLTQLQNLLDSAVQTDETIVLKPGNDFTSTPGTVIFLSRREGMKRMVELARKGEDELAMLYLPEWKAWITETKYRAPDEARIDIKFLAAALELDMETEHWHTHNNVQRIEPSPEELKKRGLQSTMPSPEDLRQYYLFCNHYPGAKFSGVIVSIHGALKYWNYDPEWAVPQYIGFAVLQDAHQLHFRVSDVSPNNLPEFARSYTGHVKLNFELR